MTTRKSHPTTKCAACGAPMIWARTKGGKRIPLDAKPTKRGNLTLSDDLFGDVVAAVVEPGQGTHVSHFATCPEATRFRGGGK